MIALIANFCVGLTVEEEICGEVCWTDEVCFKAKGNDDGLISSLCYLNHGNTFFPVRFIARRRMGFEDFDEGMVGRDAQKNCLSFAKCSSNCTSAGSSLKESHEAKWWGRRSWV